MKMNVKMLLILVCVFVFFVSMSDENVLCLAGFQILPDRGDAAEIFHYLRQNFTDDFHF